MGSRGKQHALLFLMCAAPLIANSVQIEPSHLSNFYSPSYNPQPHDFPNDQLYRAYVVIQRFKSTISCDPKNMTTTWIGHDICGERRYRGFYCTAPPGHGADLTVTKIDFNGFGLCAPKLQGFIDQLPDLEVFQATSNSLSGDIPRPYSIQANNDNFKTTKSSADEQFNQGGHCNYFRINPITLKVFCTGMYNPDNVLQNQKAVEVPAGATDAKVLFLSNNKLSGALPADLGFSKLNFLAVANNKLTGPIPSSIGHLQDSLFELLVLNNQLSGCLPAELGTLHRATVIDAGMNQLTGPIPSSFSCLSSVEQLNLGGNRLYGQVPDALCKLAAGRLANLTLSGNYFTSVGPACAALVRDGVLDVKNNCIPGLADQRRPAECAAFQSQPKPSCPAAATTQVACPAAAAEDNAAATGDSKAREYSSYVTYATLHE